MLSLTQKKKKKKKQKQQCSSKKKKTKQRTISTTGIASPGTEAEEKEEVTTGATKAATEEIRGMTPTGKETGTGSGTDMGTISVARGPNLRKGAIAGNEIGMPQFHHLKIQIRTRREAVGTIGKRDTIYYHLFA